MSEQDDKLWGREPELPPEDQLFHNLLIALFLFAFVAFMLYAPDIFGWLAKLQGP